jgi:hypothetical protein
MVVLVALVMMKAQIRIMVEDTIHGECQMALGEEMTLILMMMV